MARENQFGTHTTIQVNGYRQLIGKEWMCRRNFAKVTQQYQFRDEVLSYPGMDRHWSPGKQGIAPENVRTQANASRESALSYSYRAPLSSTSRTTYVSAPSDDAFRFLNEDKPRTLAQMRKENLNRLTELKERRARQKTSENERLVVVANGLRRSVRLAGEAPTGITNLQRDSEGAFVVESHQESCEQPPAPKSKIQHKSPGAVLFDGSGSLLELSKKRHGLRSAGVRKPTYSQEDHGKLRTKFSSVYVPATTPVQSTEGQMVGPRPVLISTQHAAHESAAKQFSSVRPDSAPTTRPPLGDRSKTAGSARNAVVALHRRPGSAMSAASSKVSSRVSGSSTGSDSLSRRLDEVDELVKAGRETRNAIETGVEELCVLLAQETGVM